MNKCFDGEVMARRTIVEIADRLGVSIATVSRALNNTTGVSAARRQEVLGVAAELGYYPNASARRLQGQRANVFCYAVDVSAHRPTDDLFFFKDFITVLAACSAAHGFDLLLHTLDSDDTGFDAVEGLLRSGRADGVILSDARVGDPRIRQLYAAELPFAVFGRCADLPDHPSVDVDGCAGIRQATEHLVERGHSRIALLGLPHAFSCALDREQGYYQALAAAGIAANPALIARDLHEPAHVYAAVEALFDLPELPTAIVATSDMLALQAMFAASRRGLHAGRNYAITGFDDLPMVAHIATPLTTLRQPLEKVCDALIAMLLRRLDGEDGPTQVLLEPELVVRESS